jgi:hypothetical protein
MKSAADIVQQWGIGLCSKRAVRHRYTVLAEELDRIETDLQHGNAKLVIHLSLGLEFVGFHVGEYGCAALLCGTQERLPTGGGFWSWLSGRWANPLPRPDLAAGWQLLQRSLLYGYWAERFLRMSPAYASGMPYGDPNGNPPSMSRRGLKLCHAIATGQHEMARWLGADLRRWRAELPEDEKLGWRDDRIENFALWLHAHWLGDGSYASWKSLGGYDAMAAAWDAGGEALKRAIFKACDWRMKHTDVPDPDNCLFEWGYDFFPYKLFPAEFLAAERVRREQGLEVVRPEHPLLRTPLANPPQALSMPKDELVERALAAVRNAAPDL